MPRSSRRRREGSCLFPPERERTAANSHQKASESRRFFSPARATGPESGARPGPSKGPGAAGPGPGARAGSAGPGAVLPRPGAWPSLSGRSPRAPGRRRGPEAERGASVPESGSVGVERSPRACPDFLILPSRYALLCRSSVRGGGRSSVRGGAAHPGRTRGAGCGARCGCRRSRRARPGRAIRGV